MPIAAPLADLDDNRTNSAMAQTTGSRRTRKSEDEDMTGEGTEAPRRGGKKRRSTGRQKQRDLPDNGALAEEEAALDAAPPS